MPTPISDLVTPRVVTVDNFPTDFPDADVLAKLEELRALTEAGLSGTSSVTANAGTNLNTSALALNDTAVAGNIKLDAILTELNQKLEAGQEVALNSATLAALETISVANFPSDYADAAALAKLEQIRTLLAGTLNISTLFAR